MLHGTGIFTQNGLKLTVNIGKYHGASGGVYMVCGG